LVSLCLKDPHNGLDLSNRHKFMATCRLRRQVN
jgi:hypothetical protein